MLGQRPIPIPLTTVYTMECTMNINVTLHQSQQHNTSVPFLHFISLFPYYLKSKLKVNAQDRGADVINYSRNVSPSVNTGCTHLQL